MKGHHGSSDARAAIMLALLVVIAALALAAFIVAACGGSLRSGSTASMTTPSTTASAATIPTAASDPAQAARTESVVTALMATWNTAWSASRDRRALLPLYADDVQYYDAAAIDTVITKSDMTAMNRDPDWWKSFRLTLGSSFVSADGRFAATLGRIALRGDKGNLPWQPAVSVLAVANDKITWECDYYGGEPGKAGQTTPMPAIPSGAVAPGSPTAQTAIAEATATISKWRSAFNGRNAASFLSSYADKVMYVDVVSPRWRVMTKSQLAADVASRFPRSEFASKLEPEPGSPLASSFFVSTDGRFAAVQGTYADEVAGGRLVDQPMLVVLELRAGQIIRQYNFIAMDRSLLRP
jgi:ketosteroid isomerase-like protein